MCELRHTSLVVQKMHRARERSMVDKDIPESAATRAVNLPHAQPATEEPGVLRAELKFSESPTEAVVRAPADGYTLLFVSTPNAVNATLYEKLNFNFLVYP
jgi:hypothetical protein